MVAGLAERQFTLDGRVSTFHRRYDSMFPVACAALVGLACASGTRAGQAQGGSPVATADTTCAVRSSDWLSLLPDGEEKRGFVLDCTGCHQFNEQYAFLNGSPRTEAQWIEAVGRMLGYAGATTSFPVISATRDPGRTAAWLAAHVRQRPTAGNCARSLPSGATVIEFMMPEPNDLPHDIAVDADGRVIVTGMFTHRLYVLEPDSTRFAEVPIPVAQANPRAVDVDPAGNWWVVLGGPMKLARYAPASASWRTWDVGMYPHSLALDRNSGRVWYNGHFTRAPELIGFVDPGRDTVRNVEVPPHPTLAAGPGGPIPYELRVGPDGRVWGSELLGNRIIGYDPARGGFTVHELPQSASGPRRFDVDARGVLWIPAYAANALARFDPSTARFESFPLPLRDAVPYVVRADSTAGILWIGTAAADALLSFDPRDRRFTVYPLPSNGALVRHLAIDPRTRDVWAAYGASPGIPARIARLRPSPRQGQ